MNAIELDRLTLARGDRIVLRELTATIRPGEFVGVFGPNGAGKTTLLHAILGLLRPKSGEIRVFGEPPARGNREAGYLPQHGTDLGDVRLRGRDFVASALHGERWGWPRLDAEGAAEVDRVLEVVQARSFAMRPLSELSGGERQRLLLAQALIGRPRLLLLDEPLVSLDPRVEHTVVALVKQLQRTLGITVLFTAHELNPLLGAMDRVLYLGHEHGAIGTVDEVMTTDVLSALYGTRIDVLRVDGRIVVVSGEGVVETDAHRHDA
jgi:zinc/manganese transport system ATP-binding protein